MKLIINAGTKTGNRQFINKKILNVKGNMEVRTGSGVILAGAYNGESAISIKKINQNDDCNKHVAAACPANNRVPIAALWAGTLLWQQHPEKACSRIW